MENRISLIWDAEVSKVQEVTFLSKFSPLGVSKGLYWALQRVNSWPKATRGVVFVSCMLAPAAWALGVPIWVRIWTHASLFKAYSLPVPTPPPPQEPHCCFLSSHEVACHAMNWWLHKWVCNVEDRGVHFYSRLDWRKEIADICKPLSLHPAGLWLPGLT